MNGQSDSQIAGEDIYINIKNYLTTYLETIFQVRSTYVLFG